MALGDACAGCERPVDGDRPGTGSQVELFAQAGDMHGNIAVSSNKAEYFHARGIATIALNGTTDSNGFYIGGTSRQPRAPAPRQIARRRRGDRLRRHLHRVGERLAQLGCAADGS